MLAQLSPNHRDRDCLAPVSLGRPGGADLARVPGAGLRDVALVHGLSTGHTPRFVLRKGCVSGLRQGPRTPCPPASSALPRHRLGPWRLFAHSDNAPRPAHSSTPSTTSLQCPAPLLVAPPFSSSSALSSHRALPLQICSASNDSPSLNPAPYQIPSSWVSLGPASCPLQRRVALTLQRRQQSPSLHMAS